LRLLEKNEAAGRLLHPAASVKLRDSHDVWPREASALAFARKQRWELTLMSRGSVNFGTWSLSIASSQRIADHGSRIHRTALPKTTMSC
jgi:hypothetical protein